MGNSDQELPENVGVGVGYIITKNQHILLLKRANVHGSGSWSTPGGHLEFGESIEECAIREVQEETGLYIKNVKFRAITNDFFDKEQKHYITIWTEGEYISSKPIINSIYEMSEIGWFKLDDLPSPLFVSFQNLINGRYYS